MADIEPDGRSGRLFAEERVLKLVQQMTLSILEERDRRYQERFEAQQEALHKVEIATEKRFESVNEFRKALSDRDVLYMPRSEANSQHESMADKLEGHSREDAAIHEGFNRRMGELSKRVDTFEGTISGGRTTLITIGGIATFLVAVIVIGTFVFTERASSNSNAQSPQVIYVPAPPNTMLPTTPPQAAPR